MLHFLLLIWFTFKMNWPVSRNFAVQVAFLITTVTFFNGVRAGTAPPSTATTTTSMVEMTSMWSNSTNTDSELGFAKTLTIIILATVLGILLIALLLLTCYVCGRQEEHKFHSNMMQQAALQQTRVTPQKAVQYKRRQNNFWGVDHAIASSLEDNDDGTTNQFYGNFPRYHVNRF